MSELRRTPLNAVHRESGARMVPFGGWDMPVEYSGLIAEHTAVRTAAGLFDVSHMGQFEVEGEGALAFLQRTTANNVAKLVDGQAQYSALPMPSGLPGGRHHRLPPLRAPLPRGRERREHREGLEVAPGPEAVGLRAPRPERPVRAAGSAGTESRGDPPGAHPDRPEAGGVLPLRRGDGERRRGDRGPHRVHRRGRLRDLRRPRRGERPLAPHRRGGTAARPPARRPRGARHAAPRGPHDAVRQRHGRDDHPDRGRARAGSSRSTRRRATSTAARCSPGRRRTARRASSSASR